MKRLLSACLLLVVNVTLAQIKNGETVPNLKFNIVLNSPAKTAELGKLKGKVVLFEFWATWCGSCLVAMPHLKALQKQYPTQLQVIAINDETVTRTKQYLVAKPSNLWFAVDTGHTIANVFPHQLIPHSVLIASDGTLAAITNPEAITARVIDSLLKGQQLHLPTKQDNLLSYEDLIKQNFFAADTVTNRFMIQGEIKGGPGLSTTYLVNKVFSGRRLTCINLSLTTLYRLANGDFPYGRVIDQSGESKNSSRYCLDIIVKNKADLLPALQHQLATRFDLQAKIEPIIKDVMVLTIADTARFKTIPRNQTGTRTYFSRHGEIDQQDMDMADFAEFLESYGFNKLVVDETGNREKLDIKFSFQPERPQSLLEILTVMGLKISQQQRKIDLLVLYK
jgi:uncharacterized protein (TIGR03435 family)